MVLKQDSRLVSILKAVSYRLFGSLATFAIAFLFTNNLSISGGIAIVETISKIGLFYVHERIWLRIGKKK